VGGFADDSIQAGICVGDAGGRARVILIRKMAGEEFVENDADGKDVRGFSDRCLVVNDFRGSVAGGAEDDVIVYLLSTAVMTGEAEVANFGVGIGVHEDVGRLDVPVDDVVLVGLGEASAYFPDDTDGGRFLDGLFIGGVVEGFSGDEFHDNEG